MASAVPPIVTRSNGGLNMALAGSGRTRGPDLRLACQTSDSGTHHIKTQIIATNMPASMRTSRHADGE